MYCFHGNVFTYVSCLLVGRGDRLLHVPEEWHWWLQEWREVELISVHFKIVLLLSPSIIKWVCLFADFYFNLCFHVNRNSQIASILDQKNYVEELNRQLKYDSFTPYSLKCGFPHQSSSSSILFWLVWGLLLFNYCSIQFNSLNCTIL